MSTLRYKDYQGSVSFEDGLLLIQILHIDDLITTQCDSASSAQQAFQELVEDYLETCKQLAKEPSKPFKGSFNVRVTPTLHRAIAMAAADAGDTMNSWVSKALDEKIDRQKEVRRLFDPLVIERLTEPTPSKYEVVRSSLVEMAHHRPPAHLRMSIQRVASKSWGLPAGTLDRDRSYEN